MSDAAQASASSKSSWSTCSSLVRPTPNEIVRDTSLMIVPTLSSTALNGVSRRMAMFPQPDVEANAGNADLLLVGNDATDRLRVTEMAIGADDAGDDVADRHAIAHLRNRRVVVFAEHLERPVLELGSLRLFGCDRIRDRKSVV